MQRFFLGCTLIVRHFTAAIDTKHFILSFDIARHLLWCAFLHSSLTASQKRAYSILTEFSCRLISWYRCSSCVCAFWFSQPLSSKNEDLSKSCYEKQADKQAPFQIYVDEPDAACTKKPPQAVQPVNAKSAAEESPLAISNAVARLRQPLARIDVPLAMDVSFGGL